jgi:hypothetical protein
MKEFKELISKVVERIFLIIWSPWGEKNRSEVDISLGVVLENDPNVLLIIGVDKDELWSPKISIEPLPIEFYSWEDFYPRIKMWMNSEDENLIIGKELYEVTESKIFTDICGNEIEGIEFINVEGNPEPFGVKILFKDDYIISLPNTDGNTIETKSFNKNNSIENFKRIGNLNYCRL